MEAENLTPLQRFRKLVRWIIKNPALVSSLERTAEARRAIEELQKDKHYKKPLYDPGAFKRKPKPKPGWLSNEVRQALAKNVEDRTEEEIDTAADELRGIPLFQRISYKILKEITRWLTIYTFRQNQVIIKEGHEAFAMYVVVHGSVSVLYTDVDKATGEKEYVEVAELGHGCQFGDVSLIHNCRRSATVRCKAVTQVLRIEREDFDKYLKNVLKRDDMICENALHTVPALKEFPWEEAGMEFASMKAHTRLQRFPKHSVIIGGSSDLPNWVYFVVNGECSYEQDVEFIVESGLGYKKLKPVTSHQSSSQSPGNTDSSSTSSQVKKTSSEISSGSTGSHMENDECEGERESTDECVVDSQFYQPKIFKKRLEICRLHFGNYFGVGEDFRKAFITTRDVVECMLIPRFLLSKAGPKFLDNLRKDIEELYPTLQVVLDRYLELQTWERYKKKVLKEVFTRHSQKLSTGGPEKEKPVFNKYF